MIKIAIVVIKAYFIFIDKRLSCENRNQLEAKSLAYDDEKL